MVTVTYKEIGKSYFSSLPLGCAFLDSSGELRIKTESLTAGLNTYNAVNPANGRHSYFGHDPKVQIVSAEILVSGMNS